MVPCTVARPPLMAERQNTSSRVPPVIQRDSRLHTHRSKAPPLRLPPPFIIVASLASPPAMD